MENRNILPLVSVSQAERLKSAGLNWPCTDYWVKAWPGSNSIHGTGWIDMRGNYGNHNDDTYSLSRPSVHIALRWLGDIKNIWAYPGKVRGSDGFSYCYHEGDTITGVEEQFGSWDEAECAALNHLLEMTS